mmetsp:Transcript_14538/g.14153  ORF Transcript_14538/g.14153 Transcript_14538/m.14153 type:complete len:123 (+) Transcript_14538:210-578(+)
MQQMRERQREQQERREGLEANEEEFLEYEPASSEDEERQDHDYNYEKEEFLNPFVIKMPDGTINIATESKDKHIKEILCWNCKSRLLYNQNFEQIMCYNCNEVVETAINNNSTKTFVNCLNC